VRAKKQWGALVGQQGEGADVAASLWVAAQLLAWRIGAEGSFPHVKPRRRAHGRAGLGVCASSAAWALPARVVLTVATDRGKR
jgi:hypothetical protein